MCAGVASLPELGVAQRRIVVRRGRQHRHGVEQDVLRCLRDVRGCEGCNGHKAPGDRMSGAVARLSQSPRQRKY